MNSQNKFKRNKCEKLFEFEDLSTIEYLDQWTCYKNRDGINLIDLLNFHGYSKNLKMSKNLKPFFQSLNFKENFLMTLVVVITIEELLC